MSQGIGFILLSIGLPSFIDLNCPLSTAKYLKLIICALIDGFIDLRSSVRYFQNIFFIGGQRQNRTADPLFSDKCSTD